MLTAEKDSIIKIINRYKSLFAFFQETFNLDELSEKEEKLVPMSSSIEFIQKYDHDSQVNIITLWETQTHEVNRLLNQKFNTSFECLPDWFYLEDDKFKIEIDVYKSKVRELYNKDQSPLVEKEKVPFMKQVFLQNRKIRFLQSLDNVNNKQWGLKFPTDDLEQLLKDFSIFAKDYNRFCDLYNKIDKVQEAQKLQKYSSELKGFEQRSHTILVLILQGKMGKIIETKNESQEEKTKRVEDCKNALEKLKKVLQNYDELATKEGYDSFKNIIEKNFFNELADIFKSLGLFIESTKQKEETKKIVTETKEEKRKLKFSFADISELLHLSSGSQTEAVVPPEDKKIEEKKWSSKVRNRNRSSGLLRKSVEEVQKKIQEFEKKPSTVSFGVHRIAKNNRIAKDKLIPQQQEKEKNSEEESAPGP